MAQVVDKQNGYDLGTRLKGLMQHAGGGPGVVGWEAAQQQQQRYAIEIAKAAQDLEQRQQLFAMGVQDRARKIQQEQQDRKTQEGFDALKLYQGMLGVKQEQQAASDQKALQGAPGPFDVLAQNQNLPDSVRPAVEQARAISKKLSPEAQKYLAERLLPEINQAVDQHQRESFKQGLADRASRGAYGEDQSVAQGLQGLQELVDSGAPMKDVAAADMKLRAGMAESQAKMAKKQRLLAYAQTQAAALPPGPAADKAERAVHDFQAELIDEKGLQQALMAAQFGEEPQKPNKRPEELYLEAAGVAQRTLGGITHTQQDVLDLTERIYQKALELQTGSTPEGKQRGRPSNLPFEQAPQNGAMGQATPAQPGAEAPPGPVQAVEQAKKLAGEASKPVDTAGALKAAEEAAKNGASDDELRAILKQAGIDPDAPASSLEPKKPKGKRRVAEHVGPNF